MTREILNAEGHTIGLGPGDPVAKSRELLHLAQRTHTRADLGALVDAARELRSINPCEIGDNSARIAFWINVYNALTRHGLLKRGARGSLLMQLGFFSSAAYQVGPHSYTLDEIEHGVLRRNRRKPLALFRCFSRDDPRLNAAPTSLDPRIHFALNCGARSCPPIRSYETDPLDAQLTLATQSYLASELSIERHGKIVRAPLLCRLYRKDFGDRDETLDFWATHASPEIRALIEQHRADLRVRYGKYDWTITVGE
ncbi:MAG: DUF547 domain-containing protein [Deltaproteobacteria bacterium]|nr:DUF547 domain-containing protein [Deltaproteobacteria bacterium]